MKTVTLYLPYFIWCYIVLSLLGFNDFWINLVYVIFMSWFSIKKVFPFLEWNINDNSIPYKNN